MYILAGANGSGKSTIAKALLPAEGVAYVNPDDIAFAECPSNPTSVKIAAGREALRRIGELLGRGESFAVESTLSGKAYLGVIERAKRLGYETLVAYVFVDSPDVCMERIAERVKNGGHFVPEADVRRRYARSRENFVRLYSRAADGWMLYYNGGADLLLVAHGGGGKTNVVVRNRYDDFSEGLCRN